MAPVELLTPQEAGARLKVTPKTIQRWAAEGAIASVTLPSGRIRIPSEAIDALLAPVPSESAS